MKKIKIKLYQKIADIIIKKMRTAKHKKHIALWFQLGLDFNTWCVDREIYLN